MDQYEYSEDQEIIVDNLKRKISYVQLYETSVDLDRAKDKDEAQKKEMSELRARVRKLRGEINSLKPQSNDLTVDQTLITYD